MNWVFGLCIFNKENAVQCRKLTVTVDFGEKLSTPKNGKNMAKVTYTLTYPHYPHNFYVDYVFVEDKYDI